MRQPVKYSALNINKWDTHTCVNGKWIPARPVGHNCHGFLHRWKIAYLVLIGRYDAVDWEE